MNAVRVRVELRERHHSHYEDREKDFRILMGKFRKAVSDAGVLNTYRQHESYESKGQKKRRKRKEADSARLKNQLKENFSHKEKS